MSRQNDIVDGEESHAAFCGSGNVARVNSEHVCGGVGRQVIDGHREFFGEDIGDGFGLDTCKNLKHSTGVNERLRITLEIS